MRYTEKEREVIDAGVVLLSRAVTPQKRGRRGMGVLLLLLITSLGLGALSINASRGEEGDLARAVSFVEELATESEVLAVFLGLGEETDESEEVGAHEDEIAARAAAYIREHNARSH